MLVTGETAFNADLVGLSGTTRRSSSPSCSALSFLLLMLAFRSIVVPLKAIVMNLLSVGAAYGLLVLVFQKGVGADCFGFQQAPTIEAWVPIFLFCVLFGLSMDYHVFLLSRIREHYDLTGDNRESVAVGLQATGKIITGAALIMVAVFAGFASGRLVMFQQMGFGLGGGRPDRRHDRPLDPGAGEHDAAGRPQLVPWPAGCPTCASSGQHPWPTGG